jgi:hypothetical protein
MTKLMLIVALLAITAQQSPACDLCAIYRSMEAKSSGPGLNIGVFEQFTHFGTMREDGHKADNPAGQRLDSFITQFILGYQVNDSFGLQLNLPYIYRSFKRPDDSGGIDQGHVDGLGDMTLIGHYRPFKYLTEDVIFAFDLLGGVKFPTGSSDRISEELHETAPAPGVAESGIHGHDLALGSGSYDAIVGGSFFARWRKLYTTAALQYAIRSQGDFSYRYANDLAWFVKPGGYLWLNDNGTLGFNLALTGENKGKDKLAGEVMEDTGMTSVFLGPELAYTWKENLSAEFGTEFPIISHNTALQLVPDYRLRAALTWRF